MKKQYALLRNNIQIGLFTLKEISKIELLPTDLVWVQAKSIAWLSPDKIDELRQYVKPAAQVSLSEATHVKYSGVAISATEVNPKAEVTGDNVLENNKDTSSVATQGVRPGLVANDTEITSKAEIEEAVKQENDTVSSGVATQSEPREPVINETEITFKAEIEEGADKDNNFSEVATQSEQPELLFSETKLRSKTEIEEGLDTIYDTVSSKVATQGEQAELVINETEINSKAEIGGSIEHPNNSVASIVSTQGEQREAVINETEITSKAEIEVSVEHDNHSVAFIVSTQGEQPEPVVSETGITSKSEIEESVQDSNNTNIPSQITDNMQAKPVVNETELIEATVGHDFEMGNSIVATLDEQLKTINQIENITKTEVEEVIDNPDINSSKSFAKAYVLLPDTYNSKKEVAFRTKVNEAPDAGKSSVTPFVMKPEIPRNTEGSVYVKFPKGLPQSLFYRNGKSIEDKLELRASELPNTKIYAAKPKPRNEK